jgi:hypothetical protein
MPIIQLYLTWVPRNGGLIDIWHDNIMGNNPLVHIQELDPLKCWMDSTGIRTITNISNWNTNEWWKG